MNQDIEKIIELPLDVEASLNEKEFVVKGKNNKTIKRNFNLGKLKLSIKDKKVLITAKKATKREAKVAGSIEAHIKNMIKGIKEDFVYKLEICNVHFPMTVKLDKDKFFVKTFLGESKDRVARIMPDTNVEIKGSEVIVSSPNIENAGQTAANIEKSTKVRNRDRRVFQDGIFITSKPE
jgi:large subunit ribosomal protein L6